MSGSEDAVQDVPVPALSHATTPDLVLPDDDIPPFAERPSPLQNTGQDANNAHLRRPSGGADSVEECDVLLTVLAEAESDVSDPICLKAKPDVG